MFVTSLVGITAYGTYIPQTRLPLASINGGRVKEGGAEKAVAAFDEDAITMAVAAAVDCLHNFDRETVDAIYFASTTSPYREKQAAALIAKALDLPRHIVTVDYSGTLRCAAGALVAAINAVKAGTAKNILVIASDSRLAAPHSALEQNLGDAAAAFLIGDNNVIASFEDSYAIADEILDIWKGEHDHYIKSWEDRFTTLHGYEVNTVEACNGLLAKMGRGAKDFTKGVFYSPDARSINAVAKSVGFSTEQLQNSLFGQVGSCGSAYTPLLLAAALESADKGDKILAVFYGDGAEAIAFSTTSAINSFKPRRGFSWHLKRRKALRSYESFLKSRHLEASEFDRRSGDGIPATVHFRERDNNISFIAHRCTECGTLHFPACRVCYTCYSKDHFENVRLSDLKGKVLSYSFDYFFPSPEPPLVVGMCEVEGGARVYVQMADATPDMLCCDLPVEFVFRKIHEAGNKPNYFWKSIPLEIDTTIAGKTA